MARYFGMKLSVPTNANPAQYIYEVIGKCLEPVTLDWLDDTLVSNGKFNKQGNVFVAPQINVSSHYSSLDVIVYFNKKVILTFSTQAYNKDGAYITKTLPTTAGQTQQNQNHQQVVIVKKPIVRNDLIYINIVRTEQNSECTMSTVRVDKFNFSCYCLERPEPDTVEEGKKKRIPVGTYQVIWHETEKNKKLGTSFNLFNDKVPAKRLILIHIGNIPDNSEGCLLFGSTKGNNSVGNSTSTIYEFYGLFKNVDVTKIRVNITENCK